MDFEDTALSKSSLWAIDSELSEIKDLINEIIDEKLQIREQQLVLSSNKKYEETIGTLTLEKNEIESKLESKIRECNKLRSLCEEAIRKLGFSIEKIQQILDLSNSSN